MSDHSKPRSIPMFDAILTFVSCFAAGVMIGVFATLGLVCPVQMP